MALILNEPPHPTFKKKKEKRRRNPSFIQVAVLLCAVCMKKDILKKASLGPGSYTAKGSLSLGQTKTQRVNVDEDEPVSWSF